MDVAGFYNEQSVFLTGATGFMGKTVLEKLMRSCPGISNFYLLMRGKGKHSAQDRLNTLLETELFSRARREQPEAFNRVHAIEGEMTEDHMGISAANLEMLHQRVSIVIHCAATVKFNEKIRTAVQMNVIGARNVLMFCKSLKTCRVFVHVSTAYAHTDRKVIEEVVYPPTIDSENLISLVSMLNDDMVKSLQPGLVGERPNTYTFTKSIAEALLAKEGEGIPIAIVRPSIITSTWREPIPGWCDNLNGVSGLALATGTGILKAMGGDESVRCDTIPVDIVANFTTVVPWYIACKMGDAPRRAPMVFNLTSGGHNPTTWAVWVEHLVASFKKNPLEKKVFRRPSLTFLPHDSVKLRWMRLMYHSFPASVVDAIFRILGKPAQMTHTISKLDRVITDYSFFTSREWTWDVKHGQQMMAAMSEADRQRFNFDLSKLHWPTYIEQFCVGLKRHMLQEDMARLHVAHRVQWRIMFITLALKGISLLALAKLVAPYLRRNGYTRSAWLLLIPALLVAKM